MKTVEAPSALISYGSVRTVIGSLTEMIQLQQIGRGRYSCSEKQNELSNLAVILRQIRRNW
jgi:hypothetical protein